ncbi:MAG: pyridoxamine 5'-phosphate oxidase family protein [Mycobacterium sp.]
MSVKVDLDELAGALKDFSFAYLITVSDDRRAHTIAVQPVLADGVFDVGVAGTTTSRNIEGQPNVTLVWPPAAPGGYSLIVDGTGLIDGSLKVTPGRAVLHRRAADMPAGPTGRPHDCVPLKKP